MRVSSVVGWLWATVNRPFLDESPRFSPVALAGILALVTMGALLAVRLGARVPSTRVVAVGTAVVAVVGLLLIPW